MLNQEPLGLSDEITTALRATFEQYPEIQQVKVFGSRAKGTYTKRSDIDLAVVGEKLSQNTINQLLIDLDDSDIPFAIDAINYHEIKSNALINHIDRVGISIFEQNE